MQTTTYIALLRGINVSGQKTIKMVDLKALIESMNFIDVKTYIQSGNIIFKTPVQLNKLQLIEKIEMEIEKHFNFHVPVILRTVVELESIFLRNSFSNDSFDNDRLYITLLSAEPDITLVHKLEEFQVEPERFVISGEEIYLFCPQGYGRTKLNNNFFELKLKTTATTRNLKTMKTLLEMALGS